MFKDFLLEELLLCSIFLVNIFVFPLLEDIGTDIFQIGLFIVIGFFFGFSPPEKSSIAAAFFCFVFTSSSSRCITIFPAVC